MIIAVGIFSIIVLLTTGAFLSLSSAQKKLQNSQEVLNELRFSLDLMGQEIIYGSAFVNEYGEHDACKNGCDLKSPGQQIVFAAKVRPDVPIRRIHYYLTTDPVTGNGIIMKGEQKTHGPCSVIGGSWGGSLMPECYQPFTSDKVDVKRVRFYVNNNDDPDEQTIINLVIQGTVLPGTKDEESFEISSSFTPRFGQDPNQLPPADNQPPEVLITIPSSDPYTTSNTSIVLQGEAADNRGVTEITWLNEATQATGTMSSINPSLSLAGPGAIGPPATGIIHNWQTTSINLKPSSVNVLTVTAKDDAGTPGSDSITVNCMAPLPPPIFDNGYAGYYCDDNYANPPGVHTKIYLRWVKADGADRYHIYRSTGGGPYTLVANTTGSDTTICTWGTSCLYWQDYSSHITPGVTYSYCIKSYSNFSGTESSCANDSETAVDFAPLQCYDGVDNDGDGLIDYSADPGCSSYCDDSENSEGSGGGGGGGSGGGGGGSGTSPDFNLIPCVDRKVSVTVNSGQGGSSASNLCSIKVSPLNGFNSSVNLSASSPHISGSNFSPNPVATNGTSYVRVFVPNSTLPGNYSLSINGSGGGASGSTSITLEVTQAGGSGGI